MKIQSSLEEIAQEKDEDIYDKITELQARNNSLNEEIGKYKTVLQKYTTEQKALLQNLMEYQQLLAKQREKSKGLEHQNKQLEDKSRELSFKLSVEKNEKAEVENMLQQEAVDRGEIMEQMETKQKVIRELSRDLTGLEAKVKRLQQQNQRLSLQNKQLTDKLMQTDAVNIDLAEKANQLEQLKQQMTIIVREKNVQPLHEDESSIK